MTSHEVYLLPVNDNGSPQVENEYIYLQPQPNDPVIVRFVIDGASPLCRNGSLFVNIPDKGQPFDRAKYRQYKCVLSLSLDTKTRLTDLLL